MRLHWTDAHTEAAAFLAAATLLGAGIGILIRLLGGA